MRLARVASIANYRIFKNFTWPTGLLPFAQFNVVYGWNGSGKTSLSSIFACLQNKKAPADGSFLFRFDDGTTIDEHDINSKEYPTVRVFNRDFIEKTILTICDSEVPPILYLGEESTAGRKEIERLTIKLKNAQTHKKNVNDEVGRAVKDLDSFYISQGKLIKEALLGAPAYANYNKAAFQAALNLLIKRDSKPIPLSDKDKIKLHNQKELKSKPNIDNLNITVPDFSGFDSRIRVLFGRSIVSQAIDSLANNPKISDWVQQGLSLHSGAKESERCLFCGGLFSLDRRAELESHFNNEYLRFQKEIEDTINSVWSIINTLERVTLTDVSRFYEHLQGVAAQKLEDTSKLIEVALKVLQEFIVNLELKKTAPFLPQIPGDVGLVDKKDRESIQNLMQSAIVSVNEVVAEHNKISANIQTEINSACKLLEENYILESLPAYYELSSNYENKKTELENVKKTPTEIEGHIAEIEQRITEHRRPADELNAELSAYLGRCDLKFEFMNNGYALKRNGKTAEHLSEGERTAISLLYFLKTLADKNFDRSNGIVVIDDPVSSLDSNSLFSSFAYIKERTKNCNQLFIFTHNFSFFRQVKNWIHHMDDQRKKDPAKHPGRFYSLKSIISGGVRTATLTPIDRLLEEYESEYHFLFKTLYETANTVDESETLSQFYSIPNMARRLLEMFMAYHIPAQMQLFDKLNEVNFDSAKKTKILRLLHTYSHAGGISSPEHDPTILAETCSIVRDIFELIEFCNKHHYKIMCERLAASLP